MLEVSVAVCELQMFDWLVEITGAGVLFMVMVFAVVVVFAGALCVGEGAPGARRRARGARGVSTRLGRAAARGLGRLMPPPPPRHSRTDHPPRRALRRWTHVASRRYAGVGLASLLGS